MSTGRRIGIRDVAAAAGVSVTTVSHALNGKGRLPAATRERVRVVAEQLGYRPSATARALVGGKSGLLGLAVAQPDDQPLRLDDFAYFVELMAAATTAAMERGYALVLAPPGPAWDRITIDGAIVVDPVIGDPLVARLRDARVPVVTTGRVPGDEVPAYWVDNDHVAGARKVLNHLAGRGASRIALVTTPPVTSYVADVQAAYCSWCVEHGVPPLVAASPDNLTEGAGFAAAAELLDRPDPPDAIWTTLDRPAIGVLLAAEARRIDVPGRLLVAATTDSDSGRWAKPPLTALELHPDRVAAAAVEMLVELVEGREPPQRHVIVDSRMRVRGSTRRARAAVERTSA